MKEQSLLELQKRISGEVKFDLTSKLIYSTDASTFREIPLGVCYPENEEDVKNIVRFAKEHKVALIPRAAGTSIAGQVVGSHLVVDISRKMNKIIECNPQEKWVRVQPGVVRDELNLFLKPHKLLFGPETSTSNRATIGGMVGNNSCGSNSIVYGSAREHTIEICGYLSDGSFVKFEPLNKEELQEKLKLDNLEGRIYRRMIELLSPAEVQQEIRNEFPKPSITRRNTGYAIDLLIDAIPFNEKGDKFNFCKLICGSEGTLMFMTEVKLNLLDLPPSENVAVCIHCSSVNESLLANIECIDFHPYQLELIDSHIIQCAKNNIEQSKNMFFIEGEPSAILIAELRADTQEDLKRDIAKMIDHLKSKKLGYHYSVVEKQDVNKVWNLRKAGLGILGNMPGDDKAVPEVEDTAVDVRDLPAYIKEFNESLAKHGLYAVHYAHAGTGELHLRPVLNMKTKKGQELYRIVGEEVADLVKKYKGSLSGEHGDGRLRAEFIEKMVGAKNYALLLEVKNLFDPERIFNPNKIVEAPPMDESLRYEAEYPYPVYKTYFRYAQGDLLREVQQCNGSGVCRKSSLMGGTMCPSYMATKNERNTTRARANTLREILSDAHNIQPFNSKEIYDVLDLCLNCKGCKSECPSNIDMAKFKSEFLQAYYEHNTPSLRTKILANYTTAMQLFSRIAPLYNWGLKVGVISKLSKRILGFATERSLPSISGTSLKQWFKTHKQNQPTTKFHSKVYFFCDEFTNFLDVEIGKKAILLLEHLGYEVEIPQHRESGRSLISKGFLKKAQALANQNVELLHAIVSEEIPLVGIEPSAILSFKDEYVDLVSEHLRTKSEALAKCTLMIDEFLAREFSRGKIDSSAFNEQKQTILLHGHCQQKSVSDIKYSNMILQIPKNNSVSVIPSGCCGMAGSFGYEKEHYELSMNVGELVLFPTIRKKNAETIVAAVGTSCRHQIKDGTAQHSLHPIEILYAQLN